MSTRDLSYELKDLALQHLRWYVNHAPMRGFGAHDGPLWMSSLDLETGTARGPERPEHISKRCYRLIESPWGSNLYWDLPLLAACRLASEDGEALFATSADAYAREYMHRFQSASGLFWWANHYFLDAQLGKIIFFQGDWKPVETVASDDMCPYHETRPLRVPWELLWDVNPKAVGDSIRAQAERHVVDPATGEFNRHADRKADHPFLEAGGILAESLCWLGDRSGDNALVELAERIVGFSFNARDPNTGLLPVSPRKIRWDFHSATSETGLWAGCLLRCYKQTGKASFLSKAVESMRCWLRAAWDPDAGMFRGRLDVRTGKADVSPRTTPYQPGEFCDPWELLFPAHDYPLQTAEACLEIYLLTGETTFSEAIEHWLRHFDQTFPTRRGLGAYAEHYGRLLHWLAGVEAAGWSSATLMRQKILAEISEHLVYNKSLLRSHPGEDRCDSVDGMGFLLWALLENGSVQSRTFEPW